MHIARIFRSVDSNMIGLKCPCGPAFLPGFRIRTNIPFFLSSANFPVATISLYTSEIYLLPLVHILVKNLVIISTCLLSFVVFPLSLLYRMCFFTFRLWR